jgi:hypothetical protein
MTVYTTKMNEGRTAFARLGLDGMMHKSGGEDFLYVVSVINSLVTAHFDFNFSYDAVITYLRCFRQS